MLVKKSIQSFLITTLCVVSISLGFVSFLQAEKNTPSSRGGCLIKEPEDRVVSDTTQFIYFKEYPDNALPKVHLLLTGTYGSILLSPQMQDTLPVFTIPPAFTRHAGLVSYRLLQHGKTLQEGVFTLLANTTKLGSIETYLGPRSIIANKRDYTMLVSIPTDTLDNLLTDSTEVILASQFKNTLSSSTHTLNNGFAWKRISAPLQTGRLSTASTLKNKSSKELVVDIFPDLAQDFSIRSIQNHSYADGNEIITFQTSQIKDKHGNIMTDGTLVRFYIKSDQGDYWQTQASTVNGYAFAKALHPQTPSTWQITAAITGIAESQKMSQTFNSIIKEIPSNITKKQTLSIGPLTSYMDQLVQDGIQVSIQCQGKEMEKLTRNGFVHFSLDNWNLPNGYHTFKIKSLGLETLKTVSLQ